MVKLRAQTYVDICIYVYMHICMYIYMFLSVFYFVDTCDFVDVCMYAYVFVYIHDIRVTLSIFENVVYPRR